MKKSIMSKMRNCILLALAAMGFNALAISAPSITSCSRTTSTSVKVSWTSVSGASYYDVRRSFTSSYGSSSSLGTTTSTSYTDSQAGVDTCYYWIVAWDSSGASATSAMGTASSGGGGSSGGSFTINASAGTSTEGVIITWSSQSGATGYRVVRGNSSNMDYASILAETVTGTSYTDTSAVAGTTYYYWIVAKKSSGYVTSSYNTGYRASSSGGGSGSGSGGGSSSDGQSYTVKFNANGGTGTMANESFVYGTPKALTANAFQRVNYRFIGWSTSSSATSATYTDKQSVSNLTATPDGTVNLYAVWKLVLEVTSVTARQRYPWNGLVDIDVTFNAGGLSTVSFTVKDTVGNTNLNARTIYVGEPSNNNRTLEVQPGTHRFVWDAFADLGQVTLSSFAVTVKVVEKNFQVNVTGGTGSGSFIQGKSVTVAAASKTGYTFASWSGATADVALLASATATSTTLTMPSRDVAYSATYTPNTYTVKFNANGGSGTMSVESFTYDTSKALAANAFTRNGWTFMGWAESASATTVKYTNGQTVKNLATSGTKNLYAVWEAQGVQLWEGGPYWAKNNLGATKPEGTGYYFWWGDTVGYKRVGSSWNAVDGSVTGFSFAYTNCPTYYESQTQLQSSGWIDGNGNLVAAHDAATKYLGTPWRLPTSSEVLALQSNTTSQCTTRNGVSGVLFTGKGGYSSRSIFVPFAGQGSGTSLEAGWTPSDGGYLILWWCSNVSDYTGTKNAYGCFHRHARLDGSQLSQSEWYVDFGRFSRYSGWQIRPVISGD